jgi:hypothetical protein
VFLNDLADARYYFRAPGMAHAAARNALAEADVAAIERVIALLREA